jgi:GntR family transcriptional regulator/MocR family aminotransferase
MHRQLYNALRAAMLEGRLPAGARLHSTRALAAQLGIARGTVVAVFEQLASEGYVSGRVGSGTAVAPRLPDSWFARSFALSSPAAVTAPTLRAGPFSLGASSFGIEPRTPRPFRAHWPAVDMFPTELWGRAAAGAPSR